VIRLPISAGKSVMLAVLAGGALTVFAVPGDAAPANRSGTSPDPGTIISPILDAISQNTPGQSEGYAVGVPRNFAWCGGSYKPPGDGAPPPEFTAVTGWGQVYPKVGARAYSNPDGNILIANAKTYVHLRATREWKLVQDQATDRIAGAHFVADFAKDTTKEMRIKTLGDSSVALSVPTTGFNAHFWLTKRGTYGAGSIDGVYVQMDLKTDDPNAKLVANVGADWWRNSTAPYVSGFANNPAAGVSNWIELSTQWSILRFYSASSAQFQAYPPPQLASATPETTPTIRRRADTSAPCLVRP
jgi:hypothetical protein